MTNPTYVPPRTRPLRAEVRAIRSAASGTAKEIWDLSIEVDRGEVEPGEATARLRHLVGFLEGLAARLEWLEARMEE